MVKNIGAACSTLLLFSMAQARPHRARQSCAREYTVNQGDTCDGISAHQQVSTYQLASLNKKINPTCTNLVIGDVLCLGLDTKDCTTVQVVQPGDMCSKIAQQAGIAVSDLFTNNPNINQDCTNIYVGEVLCVAPVSNSTSSTLDGSGTALPLSPLSNIMPHGASDPPGSPLGISFPLNSAPNLPAGLNQHSANSGANSSDSSFGLNLPADSEQGSSVIPLALNGPTNTGPNSSIPEENSGLPIPIPLSSSTLPQEINMTNTLPPLNISSTASGTPFNLTIPSSGLDSTHRTSSASGPGEGIIGANSANIDQGPSLGSPGTIEIDGSDTKNTHGPAGLFPS